MRKIFTILLLGMISSCVFAQTQSAINKAQNKESTQKIVNALKKDECYTPDGRAGRQRTGSSSTTTTTTRTTSVNSGSRSETTSMGSSIGTSTNMNNNISNTRSSGSTTTTTTTTTSTTVNNVCVPYKQ